MKKLLTVLLVSLMAISLFGCNKKEEVVQDEVKEEEKKEEKEVTEEPAIGGDLVGGWTVYDEEPQSQTTAEGMSACEKALEGLTGVGYRPFIELGSQVVSGKNYMYLAKSQVITPDANPELSIITVYLDIQENAKLMNVAKLDLGAIAGEEKAFASEKGLLGGWNVNEALVGVTLPGDAQKAYETATEKLLGVGYEPLALLGTQVVAGTNYAVLAKRTLVGPEPTTELCVMFIYADLNGGAKLTNVYPLNLAEFNR